jgi:hypothetical protein
MRPNPVPSLGVFAGGSVRALIGVAACTFGALAVATAAPAATCSAQSGADAPRVIELYTSEGCNSCPPADRWLSALKPQANVVALAFHVDYWDRLGWKDRFASPAYTQRQAEIRDRIGARFVYTPQVVIDGQDRKDWDDVPAATLKAGAAAAPVAIMLTRDGSGLQASVVLQGGKPRRVSAYWAVTENDHSTNVKAGENAGVTLRHDFVVREYLPVAAWDAQPGAGVTLRYALTAKAERAQTVALVVVDAATGRPLQAAKLAC